jgi:hypothetical protein
LTPLQKLLNAHLATRDGRECWAFPDGSYVRATTTDETWLWSFVAVGPGGKALKASDGLGGFTTPEAALVALALAGYGPLEVRTVR